MIQCIIVDGGNIQGFIEFDECKEKRNWGPSQVETLNQCAHIAGVFLSKLRLQQKAVHRMKQIEDVHAVLNGIAPGEC